MGQLDTSMYRQPQNLGNIGESFLAGQQAAAQQQGQQQSNEIRQFQLDEHRQRAELARQEAVTEQKIRALFSSETPPTTQAIISAVGPERGATIIKGLGALQKENQAQYTSQQELLRDVMAGMDALPEGLRAEAYPGIRQNLVDRQLIGAQDVPEAYDPAWFAQARGFGQKRAEPKAPGTREVKVRNADGSETVQIVADTAGQSFESAAPLATPTQAPHAGSFEDYLVRYAADKKRPVQTLSPKDVRAAKAEFEAAGRAPQTGSDDPGPLETIIGPDGKPIRVRRQDAIGKAPGASTEKASSGIQKKALAFFNRAQQADVDLEGLEDSFIKNLSLAGQARLSTMPNIAQSGEGQRYKQAQRAFTEARLRKDSGAAIPAHEFESDRKTYFVETGDKPAVIEQKRRARGAMLASLGFESGQALGEFIGDADEAAAIVKKYRDRSAATPAPAGPKKIGRFEIVAEP